MIAILAVLGVVIGLSLPLQAQSTWASGSNPFFIEIHAGVGPMYSIFRERQIPPGGSKNTFGYQGIFRVMWHPDHLLAIGLVTGHQLIATERFSVDDEFGQADVHAWLSATPALIDVSMQDYGLELGIGLGAFIMRSVIEDGSRTEGVRTELGAIGHLSYHRSIATNLSLGGELGVTYLSYRGILSFVPRLEVRYDIPY